MAGLRGYVQFDTHTHTHTLAGKNKDGQTINTGEGKKERNVTTVFGEWVSYWDVYPACLYKRKKKTRTKIRVPSVDRAEQTKQKTGSKLVSCMVRLFSMQFILWCL